MGRLRRPACRDGSQLVYGSYLGGSGDDWPADIELREPRVLTVGGTTTSADFRTTPDAVQASYGGGFADYFVSRLDLDQLPAAQLRYSTFLGGSASEGPLQFHLYLLQCFDLHVDTSDRATLTGYTHSADFPTTANAFDQTFGGVGDVVLTRIDPGQFGAAGLVYSTFLGGSGVERAFTLAVDAAGVATVGGATVSADFPTTPGAFDTTFHGPAGHHDAFLARLDPSKASGEALRYSTFVCGDGDEELTDLVLEAGGEIIAQGWTGAAGLTDNAFPTTCGAYSETFGGDYDAFLLYLDPAGNGLGDLRYSTFLGGSSGVFLWIGMELVPASPAPTVVAAGQSDSTDFPTTPGAFQEDYGGGPLDGIVLQLELNPHTYCHAEGNSANPDGAQICGSGSVVVADNGLTLSATGLPNNKFGFFLMSATKIFVPNMGGGNGNLCLGAPQIRFAKNIVNSGSTGQVSFQPDLTNLPQGTVVHPGEVWYFQLWYRDVDPVQTSNTSNGLAVTFH